MTEIQNVSQLTALIQNPPRKAPRTPKSSASISHLHDQTSPESAFPGPVPHNTYHEAQANPSPSSGANHPAASPFTTGGRSFVSAMDLFRSQQRTPQVSSRPTGQDVMRNVSKTQLEKHAVKMRQMAKALESSHKLNATTRHQRAVQAKDVPNVGYIAPSGSNATWRQTAMDRIIGTIRSQTPSGQWEADADVTHELDRDVARAIVYLGGKVMGVPPEELHRSPGLQKLVARNTQWFQRTPDWFKLLGLCAAKKFNCYLQSSSSTGESVPMNPLLLPMETSIKMETNEEDAVLVPMQPHPPIPSEDEVNQKKRRNDEMMMSLDATVHDEEVKDNATPLPPPPPKKAKKNPKNPAVKTELVTSQKKTKKVKIEVEEPTSLIKDEQVMTGETEEL